MHADSLLTLDPESIIEALENKKIYPSMALCFIVISFYYGFVCGGGFSQVNYLKNMKEAWVRILGILGENREALAVEKIPTNIFFGEVIYLFKNQTEKNPAYSLDLLLDSDFTLNHQKKSQEMRLKESFLIMCTFFSGTLESVFE